MDEKALEESNIPCLRIETDYSMSIGQLKTRIEAFEKLLKQGYYDNTEFSGNAV